jgi:hypothetical protein
MARKQIPCEDRRFAIQPHADTSKGQDEFQNGDCICICYECNKKFIGMINSYFCPTCLNEIY